MSKPSLQHRNPRLLLQKQSHRRAWPQLPVLSITPESTELTLSEEAVQTLFRSVPMDSLKAWAAHAEKCVRCWVQIKTEPKSETDLRQLIESSGIGRGKGTPTSPSGIFYGPKLSGEAVTQPHIRQPSFRVEHLRKCFKSVLNSRDDPLSIHEGGAVVIFDGGKAGPNQQVPSSESLVMHA